MTSSLGPQHWNSMAEFWAQLGSPLRPSAEDQRGYESFIRDWITRGEELRAMILGVTPELYRLSWPEKCDLIAVDRARVMIDEVWPGPPERAIESDWLRMPLAPASRDLALCDGGLILLEYPRGHRRLIEQLHQLLIPNGRCIFRLFVPPAERESVETVLHELVEKRIANLNILKLRLAMAMQTSPEEGVPVQEILRTVERIDADLGRVAERAGWTFEHLRVIETYRDSPARYCFPTEAKVRTLFGEEKRFAFIGHWHGTYPLAERCPIVAFARR